MKRAIRTSPPGSLVRGAVCALWNIRQPLASLPLGAVSAFGAQTVCRLCQVWEQGGAVRCGGAESLGAAELGFWKLPLIKSSSTCSLSSRSLLRVQVGDTCLLAVPLVRSRV